MPSSRRNAVLPSTSYLPETYSRRFCLSFSHAYCAFNVMDEVVHKFYLVGFVRIFGIYAKPFFESGQKFSNLNQIKPEIIGHVGMRVHRGDIDF